MPTDDGQGSLFGSSDPCPARSITACRDDEGRTCGCRWALRHTGPHVCLTCNEVIRAATLARSAAVLFAPPADPPLVRSIDRERAHEAAAKVSPKTHKIQRVVIDAYREHGDMTSKVAEALPEFAHYGRSTIQKRTSELFLMGILELVPDAADATYQLNEERIVDPLVDDPVKCSECGQLWRPAHA